ncbi:MAG: hypothetical protein AAGF89_15290 [Bacteroidota bacterium]
MVADTRGGGGWVPWGTSAGIVFSSVSKGESAAAGSDELGVLVVPVSAGLVAAVVVVGRESVSEEAVGDQPK